jgi:hypothetical protein
MKWGLLSSLLLLTGQICASEHALGAHEHGSVKMAIAVEKNVMDIDLDGPSDSFMGFEHTPKGSLETKIYNETKELWEKKLLTVLTPAQDLGCKISESTFKQTIEGSHADVEAKAKMSCTKNLAGTELTVSLLKRFTKIKKMKVDVLSTLSTTVDVTKKVQVIKL